MAFESSCDETSVAVVDRGVVLSTVVASQMRLHAEYGGVVPELATREHLRNLLPVARAAMAQAGVSPERIEAVAATRGPGLPAALRAGFAAGQAFAAARGLPFFGIHHHEAHLYSPWISGTPPRAEFELLRPHVSLIVSGGHTLLVHVRGLLDHEVLGGTLDDAAGECFDKIAKLLRLPYPGGPVLDQLAEQGSSAAFNFPRPLLTEPNCDFSFSGLKTSVRVFLERRPGLADDPQGLRDLCASVRAAIVETLVVKSLRTVRRLGLDCFTASGGVTCNAGLRRELAAQCARRRIELRLASPALCTDNAAMVALLAERCWRTGIAVTPNDAEPLPGWSLADLRRAA